MYSSLRRLPVLSSLALLALFVASPLRAMAQPSVTGVVATDELTIEVTFDQDIDPTSGSTTSRYQVYRTDMPTNQIAVSSASVSGPTATLTLASAMTGGTNYTLRSAGIQPLGGGTGSALSVDTFDAPFTGTITSIADIQADPASYEGQVVTVEGQVYIPSDYRGTVISGYIQGASGRGINVFGSEADVPALKDVTAIVRLTGSIHDYSGTIEIQNLTMVQTLSTGNPELTPQSLTTGQASSSDYEGTYIEVSGTVQSSSVGGPGTNYVVDDGSGSIIVRVVDTLGVATIGDGATITASGAGGIFGTDYQVLVGRVSDIQSSGGNGGGDVTPIADIQADAPNLEGATFTIEGQIYIPTNSRGGTPSGYIQDGSGRGINLYGNGAGAAALQDRSAIVRLTGDVTNYFTTVELENVRNVQTISTGNPLLTPVVLSVQAANSSEWEGTYIEVHGEITGKSNAGGADNYSINDGTGSLDVRIAESLGLSFDIGQTLYARGAGGKFQSTYQVLVGLASEVDTRPFDDQSPPRLTSAYVAGPDIVKLDFSEELEDSSAVDVNSYSVEASDGTSPEIVMAELSSSNTTVALTLDQEIDVDQVWTVTVMGLADLSGNRMTEPQTATIGGLDYALDGPARTFLPRLGEEYPISIRVPVSVHFTGGQESELLVRIFDLEGRLVATLYDSRFDPADVDFADGRETLTWDGRDEYKERVPAGAYIVHMRAVDEETGKTHELQMPVVVASRLQQR